jgi:hypothetical protein
MNSLSIVYLGDRFEVDAAHQYSFGRSGNLSIDSDNSNLHRVLGSFSFLGGLWWLENVGAQTPLHIEGDGGTTALSLAPGASIPLVLGDTMVRFAAGGNSYELLLDVQQRSDSSDPSEHLTPTFLPLTVDQLLLLIALAEPRLRRGPAADLPGDEELIGRFGWSATRLHRKLDDLATRFAQTGPASPDEVTRYVIASGLITVNQLSLLPPREGLTPTSSSPVSKSPIPKQHKSSTPSLRLADSYHEVP